MRTPALLKNMIRCGHCDKPMGITFTKKGARRYRYYLCQNANKSGYEACPVRTVPAGDVERAVMIQLHRVFQATEVIEETLKVAVAREEADRKRLTEEQERIRAELKTLKGNVSRLRQSKPGKDSNRFAAEEIIRLEAQSESLIQRLAALQAESDLLAARPPTKTDLSRELATLDRIWEELFPREKERIINLLVESVVVSVQGIDLSLRADGLRSLTAELTHQEVAHA